MRMHLTASYIGLRVIFDKKQEILHGLMHF